MKRLRQLIHEIHRRSLWQVLGIYLVASWAVLQVVDTLGGALRLPEWLEPMALVLLIIGLPIVLATAFVREGGPGRDGGDSDVAAPAAPPGGAVSGVDPSAIQQEIRFCTASDGVRIAYATSGKGPPLVKAANWLNHLEYDWQSPVWRHLLQELTKDHSLIRYDERGNGLSDWEVADISFDAFVRDLETVIDAAGLERFALLGISQGCAVSIAYAVRHPERVTHLVLYGGYARGQCKRGSPEAIEAADAVLTLMRHGWGSKNPAFRQIFTSRFIPDATPEQMQWFDDLQRMTASPENAIRIRQVIDDIDVDALLPQVTVPTVVLHCRDDAAVPFEEGRRMAAGISGARFVELEGRNHLILEDEPAWPRFLNEVRAFLGQRFPPSGPVRTEVSEG